MPEKELHIVSFSIPYPPNYGGVIDVYYKLKALYKAGVAVHLHCFQYDRGPAPELEQFCASVSYHPRQTGFVNQLSWLPYIVKSRTSAKLINRLILDRHPILFEGLHSCYYLNYKALHSRKLIYRESNIEHHYYYHLFLSEKNIRKKAFFLLESIRLRLFQRRLRFASTMLAVSQTDAEYLKSKFPDKDIRYLPSFHGNESVKPLPGLGDFVLYHGNLGVAENSLAAEFLIREVFSHLDFKFIIAGLTPPQSLCNLAAQYPNIEVIANPPKDEMERLVRAAQVNVLVTFQATGLKLKLLNTLYNGRWMLVNSNMLAGTGLESICETAETPGQLRLKVSELMQKEFVTQLIEKRCKILEERYSDTSNVQDLIRIIFG